MAVNEQYIKVSEAGGEKIGIANGNENGVGQSFFSKQALNRLALKPGLQSSCFENYIMGKPNRTTFRGVSIFTICLTRKGTCSKRSYPCAMASIFESYTPANAAS
jgi:hypothetical protein